MKPLRIIILLLLLCSVGFASEMGTLKDLKSAFNQSIRNATLPDSELVIFINDGIQQVADDLRCFHKRDTIVTSNGNSDYALNSDCLLNGVDHVELKSGGARYGLDEVPRHEIGKLAERGGCPQTYYAQGQILTVYPEGTSLACTLIVTYAAEPNYLDLDTANTGDLPMPYRFTALMYSAYRYYDTVNRDQDAAQALTAYQAAITRKRAALQPQPTVTATGTVVAP